VASEPKGTVYPAGLSRGIASRVRLQPTRARWPVVGLAGEGFAAGRGLVSGVSPTGPCTDSSLAGWFQFQRLGQELLNLILELDTSR
jgi:hypothetical protein